MEIVMLGIAGLFFLVSLICNILILIHAFKSSVGEGFMCLCIPCYGFYYMFAKFDHPQKGLIIGGAIGGSIICNVLVRLGMPTAGYGGY